jgi:uncharacterized caspase-like protein
MQRQFTDLSESNGAIVISAAGGMEYAYESANWSNGVFTYCLRDALDNFKADVNYDGRTTVQELQSYVSKKVPELTANQQRPTSRVENIEFDWTIK